MGETQCDRWVPAGSSAAALTAAAQAIITPPHHSHSTGTEDLQAPHTAVVA